MGSNLEGERLVVLSKLERCNIHLVCATTMVQTNLHVLIIEALSMYGARVSSKSNGNHDSSTPVVPSVVEIIHECW